MTPDHVNLMKDERHKMFLFGINKPKCIKIPQLVCMLSFLIDYHAPCDNIHIYIFILQYSIAQNNSKTLNIYHAPARNYYAINYQIMTSLRFQDECLFFSLTILCQSFNSGSSSNVDHGDARVEW